MYNRLRKLRLIGKLTYREEFRYRANENILDSSSIDQIPLGYYLITEEGFYMIEEDNENKFMIQEDSQ